MAFGGRVGGTLAPFLTIWMIVTMGHWRMSLWVDGAIGLRHRSRKGADRPLCIAHIRDRVRCQCRQASTGLLDHVLDEPGNHPAHKLVHGAAGIESRMHLPDPPDQIGHQWHFAEIVKRKQLRAQAIVDIVNTPFGKRPFRVHYDPTQDGADVGFTVLDRLRAEMLHRVGLADLLSPAKLV